MFPVGDEAAPKAPWPLLQVETSAVKLGWAWAEAESFLSQNSKLFQLIQLITSLNLSLNMGDGFGFTISHVTEITTQQGYSWVITERTK